MKFITIGNPMSFIQITAKFLSKDINNYSNFLVLEDKNNILVNLNSVIRSQLKAFSPINLKKPNLIYLKILDQGIPLLTREDYNLGLYLVKNIKANKKVYFHFVIQSYQRIQNYTPVDINELSRKTVPKV